ncbi:asparaginase [Paenibacillus sp. IITD108]|uniref:asparaginase n=1 Tax=Paenibacillus sp. IITD108 TaxID=3116649 RepID=UPI002F3F73BC
MKRVLVVFTGGTIGSRRQQKSIHVAQDGAYAILEEYKQLADCRNDIILDTAQPLNILSENLTPHDWHALATAIHAVETSQYDGILVTHGSDTLAYTAAMMSYLFADISIPLVFTASNYPIADERSNGIRNFSHSLDFIAEASLPGVFVVYENDQGVADVYLGTQITQCKSFTDQFGSPYNIVYGRMLERRFEWQQHERNPRPESLSPQQQPFQWTPESLKLESDIVYIKPYPGLKYSYYAFGESKPRAVLHDLHHSGTACAVEQEPYSLLRFMERCRAAGVDLYICPVKDASAAMYSSSVALIEAGAIIIEKMSMEAALTKLMLAYSLYTDLMDVKQFMLHTPVYYEQGDKAIENGKTAE